MLAHCLLTAHLACPAYIQYPHDRSRGTLYSRWRKRTHMDIDVRLRARHSTALHFDCPIIWLSAGRSSLCGNFYCHYRKPPAHMNLRLKQLLYSIRRGSLNFNLPRHWEGTEPQAKLCRTGVSDHAMFVGWLLGVQCGRWARRSMAK